ncbi:MAG: hypothetical protein V3S71_06520 [Acidobacteriota bacterium]
MTFEEVRVEAERYSFGPDTELICKEDWLTLGRESTVWLGLRHRRPDIANKRIMRDGSVEYGLTWINQSMVEPLRCLDQESVRGLLESCWRDLWQHEMEEWMTCDGERVHDPHKGA